VAFAASFRASENTPLLRLGRRLILALLTICGVWLPMAAGVDQQLFGDGCHVIRLSLNQ
jgi:hypothetical protein